MTSDIVNDNFWAFIGPDGTVYMSYVHGPTKPSLFSIAFPGLVIAPDAALGLPVEAVQEGDIWTVTQPMRDDYTWSDGSILTAADVVFTYEAVRDAELGGDWISAYPYTEASSPRLTNVEAVDEFTVKFTFDSKPGAAVWPHNVGVASIMPAAPWEPVLAEALASEDPAAIVYGASSLEVGDLSGGPVSYNGREEGAFVENIKNENYANAGSTHTFWQDGSYAVNDELLYGEGGGDIAVEYTEGPFLDRTSFSIYGDQAAAMLALADGEIDYWINPLGVSPGLRQQGLEADNLSVTVNPTNGFRYLAFNLRKSPGKFLGFRQAMAYFDKENLTQNVLQGVAFPLYVLVPEGNQAWYNEEVADEIASQYVGLSTTERLNAAYAALEADGFTWTVEAVRDEDGNILEEEVGSGLIDPEGNLVPEVEIMAPSATYDPLRHTASLWLEDWAENLGVNARANPTDFNTIVAQVWPGVGTEPTFDMYILGWSLGNPAWPTFHEGFFHSRNFAETNDGGNATGYSDAEFDALADAMFAETDKAVAFDQIWEMERKLATDLPYVVLFDTPITEFYNNSLQFPFTGSLSGIQFQDGMQNAVAK
ncbi:MAG: ABC transporter substrate-binding protein [Acidobacteria bacterium]|nr:ABC transporter substrate-binding protein [Acidobacteriota bacterium]